ncbi:hypothetical protein HK100_000703 [Physocladia obscura]|uniref:Transmembrane protein 14 n=1 Tax=Physocladia obscura TaxID=109957 RepID=A0AAD5T3Z3_9FUNG|nr:hypothetical protein HK100_000703 [Physocladia obscura]
MADHLANTLAAVCGVGGIVGYAKGKSVPSLVAGIGFGALYATSGYLIKKNADYGVELALGSSLVLVGATGPRALRTRKNVPVLMATLGFLGSGYYAKKLYQNYYGV